MARPDPIRRFLYRLPLYLAPLGIDRLATRLTGVEWMVLNTVGRRTGRPRPVVLDVLHHDTARDIYYVQPASGARADWVRNALQTPNVTASVGPRRFHAHIRDATGAEGAAATLRLVREHRWYAHVVAWFVGHVHGLGRSDADLLRDMSTLVTLAVEVVEPSNERD